MNNYNDIWISACIKQYIKQKHNITFTCANIQILSGERERERKR